VDNTNIPEWQVCQELGIELVSQVGRPKLWSSSDFLKEWGEFWLERGNARPGQASQKPAAHLPSGEAQPGGSARQRQTLPNASTARPESGFGAGA
jgi:hypothetical protein